MSYVPNPTDVTNPTDAVSAETAAAEFRALKLYLSGLVSGGSLGLNIFRKNRIGNGRLLVDQRFEGTVTGNIAATVTYGPDRWAGAGTAAAGTFTLQRLATGITGASSLFFLRGKVTTIDAAPAAASIYALRTVIEGFDCQDLFWGTAGAKTIALGFWAQSSVAGTYNFALVNNAANRTYLGQFVIAAANTPQFFSFVIPGDTTGVWTTDNTAGITVFFTLATGATGQGVAGWQAGNLKGIAGATNIMATLNATLDITDVQIEVGQAATAIEIIPLAEEFIRIWRYFVKSFNVGTVPATNVGVATGEVQTQSWVAGAANISAYVRFPVPMRTAPTVTTFNPGANNAQFRDEGVGADGSAIAASSISAIACRLSGLANAASVISSLLGVHFTATADF